MLSTIAKLYHPFGWLCPVIIIAKIIMQDIWKAKLEWDDNLPPSLEKKWANFCSSMASVALMKIPRWLSTTKFSSIELHGFADASKNAYAVAIYLRVVRIGEECTARLLVAKTRVYPLKQLSIPRLELCAATLLAKLMSKAQDDLQRRDISIHTWTDSKIVLHWIRSDPFRWEVFVGHRVAEIHRHISDTSWRYVPSRENPDDVASREMDPHQLPLYQLWWNGPCWLKGPPTSWPQQINTEIDSSIYLEFNSQVECHQIQTSDTPEKGESAVYLKFS